LAARALRVTLAVVAATSVVAAAVAPVLISVLFGSAFSDSVPMAWILLLAGVPLAGATVLAQALTADGRAGIPAVGEICALVVTAAGLAVLLSPLAGIGAALVSLVAYTVNFAVQLVAARRAFGGRIRSFLFVSRSDLVWGWSLARTVMVGWKAAARRAP
jgi:O-antigen/teichoic acid export membrane protein